MIGGNLSRLLPPVIATEDEDGVPGCELLDIRQAEKMVVVLLVLILTTTTTTTHQDRLLLVLLYYYGQLQILVIALHHTVADHFAADGGLIRQRTGLMHGDGCCSNNLFNGPLFVGGCHKGWLWPLGGLLLLRPRQ